MKTEILKIMPQPVIKPWGLLHGPLKELTGISVGVGELWLASAQTGEGNFTSMVTGDGIKTAFSELLQKADKEDSLEKWLGASGTRALKKASFRGKTEAWLVRYAQGFAGFAAGPSDEQKKKELKKLLTGPGLSPDIRNWSENVRSLLGLIAPIESGESFLVPAGTLHTMFALGRDSRLVVDEIQQGYGSGRLPTLSKTLMVQDNLLSIQVHPDDETVRRAVSGELSINQDLQSNPTVRVYDFGRRPGEYPELGFKLADTSAGLRNVQQLTVEFPGAGELTFAVASPQFIMSRLTIKEGAEIVSLPVFGSYHVLHCTKGAAEVMSKTSGVNLTAGETAFVPGELERDLKVLANRQCEIVDQAVPNLEALKKWCVTYGVGPGEVEKLLDPPRA